MKTTLLNGGYVWLIAQAICTLGSSVWSSRSVHIFIVWLFLTLAKSVIWLVTNTIKDLAKVHLLAVFWDFDMFWCLELVNIYVNNMLALPVLYRNLFMFVFCLDSGTQVQEMSTAALGYHRVVKENRVLYNMVQDLKGLRNKKWSL